MNKRRPNASNKQSPDGGRRATRQRSSQRSPALSYVELFFEQARDIMLVLRPDGQIVQANHAAVAAYGYDRDELCARRIQELRAPSTVDSVAAQLGQAERQGLLFETVHRRRDGSLFPVEVSAQGAVVNGERLVVSVIRDVSERKQAAAALQQRDERYQAFIEQSSEGIWRFELEQPIATSMPEDEQIEHFLRHGYLAECNNVMARMYGYVSSDQLIGARLSDFLVPTDPRNIAYLRAFIRSGYRLEDAETHEVDRDGRTIFFSNNLIGIVEGGQIARAWGTQRDVTGRKRAEELLTMRSHVLDSMLEGVSISDEQGVIVYTNPAEDAMFGYERGELIGQHVTVQNTYPPEENARIVQDVIEQLKAGGAWQGEFNNRKKDGTPFVTFARITALSIDERQFWVCVQEDIGERKRVEQALRSSQERLALAYRAARLGTFDWNIQTSEVIWTEEQEALYGLPPGGFGGQYDSWSRTVHPDDRARAEAEVQRAAREGLDLDTEFRVIWPDGSIRWLLAKAQVVRDEAGQPLRMIGVNEDITDRKRAEEGLRYQLNLNQTITANTAEALFLMDAEGRTTFMNPAAEEMFGWTAAEMLGNVLHDQIHYRRPDGSPYPNEECALGGVFWSGQSLRNHEDVFLHKNGSMIPVLCSNQPIVVDGKVVAAVLSVSDITERKRVEKVQRLLAEASTIFTTSFDDQAILQQIARVVVPEFADWCVVDVVQADGTIGRAAAHGPPATLRQLEELRDGAAPNDPHGAVRVIRTGQPEFVVDILPTLFPSATSSASVQLLQSLGARSSICVPLTVRGAVIGAIAFALSGPGRRYEAEDLSFAEELARRCALAVDNARLHSTTQQAAERAARLYAVAAALSGALTTTEVAAVMIQHGGIALGADGGAVVTLTPDGSELELLGAVGYPDDDISQYQCFPVTADMPLAQVVRTGALVLVESREAARAQFPDMVALHSKTELHAWANIPLVLADNTIGAVEFNFRAPRRFSEDDRGFMLTIARQCAQALDRARLYEAERRARAAAVEAVRIRDAFLSIASHELKTPLTTLLGNAQLLQRRAEREGDFNDRNRRALGIIVDQASRLNRMITALLDISRIELGQLSIEHAAVDVVQLTQRVVDEVQPGLERHTVTYDGPDEPAMIVGDALRLEQVLQNLISNALKYSPNGGAVVVEVRRSADDVFIAVRDQGIGIPPEALPQLFSRFYRAGNADPQHISGMGIGLYVVKEIVTLHGGRVEVSSAEGAGSTFTVCLPLEPQPLAAPTEGAR